MFDGMTLKLKFYFLIGVAALIFSATYFFVSSNISPIEKNLDVYRGEIESIFGNYRDAIGTGKKMVAEGEASSETDGVIKTNDSPALNSFDTLEKQYETMTDNTHKKILASISKSNKVLAGSLVLVFLIVAVISFGMRRAITKPLGEVIEKLGAISQGSLNQEIIEIKTKDEIRSLVDISNELLERHAKFHLSLRKYFAGRFRK